MAGYDALLLLSFGGPEGPDDVLPFLRNVTRGRGVPDERLAEVAEHYQHFGGVSPINEQNRALLAAIRDDFAAHGAGLCGLYWGNRNWHPYVADTVRTMRGRRPARARLRDERDGVVLRVPAVPRGPGRRAGRGRAGGAGAGQAAALLRPSGLRRGQRRLACGPRSTDLPSDLRDGRPAGVHRALDPGVDERLVRTGSAGSISTSMRETARLVAEAVRGPRAEFDLVWQSRSGPPQVPWLEPDINDHLRALAADGDRGGRR